MKCVCPICGGRLATWVEYVYDKKRLISKNGNLTKTTRKGEETAGGNWGIECLECKETWSATKWGSGVEGTVPVEIEKILKIISTNVEG